MDKEVPNFGGYGRYFSEMERLGQWPGLPEGWAARLIEERRPFDIITRGEVNEDNNSNSESNSTE